MQSSKIFDSRRRYDKLEYFLHWHSYNINKQMLELAKNVVHVPQRLQEFYQLYPDKP